MFSSDYFFTFPLAPQFGGSDDVDQLDAVVLPPDIA
jgi:hypothetical protein